MKLLKLRLFLLGLPLCALAMQEEYDAPITVLSEDVLTYIFQFLNEKELAIAAMVTTQWNRIANDEKSIWLPLCKNRLGAWYSEYLKQSSKTAKRSVMNIVARRNLSRQVLTMASWSAEELTSTLSESNYPKTEMALLENLEAAIIEHLRSIGINSANKLALCFLNHYMINMGAAWEIVWDASLNAAKEPERLPAWNAVTRSGLFVAWDAGKDVANILALDFGWELSGQDVLVAVDDAVRNPMKQACEKLTNTPDDFGEIVSKLSTLYVLAYFAREEFVREQFVRPIQPAFTASNGAKDKRSKDKITQMIGENTWLKEGFTESAYFKSLNRIMEALGQQIN